MKHSSMKHLNFKMPKADVNALWELASVDNKESIKTLCDIHNELFPHQKHWATGSNMTPEDVHMVYRHLYMYAQ